MSRTSLYSLHNDLDPGRGELAHVQLNPAVVLSDAGDAFTLSVVCIGPRLADGGRITLGLESRAGSVTCESLHCRTDESGGDLCLTVAVFPATRALLERLAEDVTIRVSLESGRRRSVHSLSEQNRRNVVHFLDEAGHRPGSLWHSDAEPVAV